MKNGILLIGFLLIGITVSAQIKRGAPETTVKAQATKASKDQPLINFYGKKMHIWSHKTDGKKVERSHDDYVIFFEDGRFESYSSEADEIQKGKWTYQKEELKLTFTYDNSHGGDETIAIIKEIQDTKLKLASDNHILILYIPKKVDMDSMPTEIRPAGD